MSPVHTSSLLYARCQVAVPQNGAHGHGGRNTRVRGAMSGTPTSSPERVVSAPNVLSIRRTPNRISTRTDSPYVQAIRKKIEGELARKRTISTTNQPAPGGRRRRDKPNVQKGTVAALKPSPALTVPENITVSEASQLCAAKRTDCVLVVDDDEGLSGIFTAKDLAYRVRTSPIVLNTRPDCGS